MVLYIAGTVSLILLNKQICVRKQIFWRIVHSLCKWHPDQHPHSVCQYGYAHKNWTTEIILIY